MKGIIPRITEQIFASIMASPANLEYLVKVSYMEIYMERIRDLLARMFQFSLSLCLEIIQSLTIKGSEYDRQQPRMIIYQYTKINNEEFTLKICQISTLVTLQKFMKLCVKVVALVQFQQLVREAAPLSSPPPTLFLFLGVENAHSISLSLYRHERRVF